MELDIVLALIGAGQAITVAGIGAAAVYASKSNKRSREVHEQVVNHHAPKSNLRDDIDSVKEDVAELKSTATTNTLRLDALDARFSTGEHKLRRKGYLS